MNTNLATSVSTTALRGNVTLTTHQHLSGTLTFCGVTAALLQVRLSTDSGSDVPGSPSDLNTGNGTEDAMVCTSLVSLLCPLFYFLCSNLKANPVYLEYIDETAMPTFTKSFGGESIRDQFFYELTRAHKLLVLSEFGHDSS